MTHDQWNRADDAIQWLETQYDDGDGPIPGVHVNFMIEFKDDHDTNCPCERPNRRIRAMNRAAITPLPDYGDDQ